MLGFGHLIEMQIRLKQNDALRKSRRKAEIKKEPHSSGFHYAAATSSKFAIKQSQKWTKKEIIFSAIIIFLIIVFVTYRVCNPFVTRMFFHL